VRYTLTTVKSIFIPAILLAAALAGVGCQHDSGPVRPGADAAYSFASYRPNEAAPSVAEVHARTAAHLEYAEEVLRHKATRRLPSHLRRRRYQALKLLHTYRLGGEFPVLAGADTARPCLRDNQGRVDALGYLLRETGSAILLDELSRRYPRARVEAIDNAALRHWVSMSGLTMEECALIQGAN
jgi:hypothetical protein